MKLEFTRTITGEISILTDVADWDTSDLVIFVADGDVATVDFLARKTGVHLPCLHDGSGDYARLIAEIARVREEAIRELNLRVPRRAPR